MRKFDFDYLLWVLMVFWFFNGFDFVFDSSSDKKEDKTVISIEKKKSEDKDTIKTDW